MFWSFVGRILLARWLIVAVVALGALAGGAFVAITSPREYDGTARVMLNIYKPDPITGRVLGKKTVDPYLQTQINLVRDFQVVGRAIEAVGWLDDPEILQAYNERDPGDQRPLLIWLAQALIGNMQVGLVDDSNIIEIRYRGESPEVAALVVGAIRDAYITASIEERRAAASSDAEVQAERAERLRLELLQLEGQKRALEAQTGVVLDFAGKNDVDTQRLTALSAPGRAPGAPREDPIVTRRGSTTDSLSQVEMELAQAQATLGPNHPRLIELRATRNTLSAIAARDDDTGAQVAATVLARERVKQAEFEAQRSRVLDQRQNLLRVRLVQDQIDFKRRALETAQKQVASSRSLSTATESGLTAVGNVDSSPEPSFPNIPLILGGTGGIGLVAGIVIAMLVEMFNLRVRTQIGLRIATSVPVLGTVPALRAAMPAKAKRVRRLRKLKPVTA